MDRERMELPQELDDFIKETIDSTLGLPSSARTLEVKLRASEEAQRRLHGDCVALNSRLMEKEKMIDKVKAEANMNAVALKKFVEENQKLASECTRLLSQHQNLENEILMFERDREILMDFGNESDQRAKEAEARTEDLQTELRVVSEELQYFKRKYEATQVKSSPQGVESVEEGLLESVLATILDGDEAIAARSFLEENGRVEPCKRLLDMWSSLKPLTRKVLSLAAASKAHEKEKEITRVNLCRAEDEVFLLDEENKKLVTMYQKEKNCHGSCRKQANSGSAAKSNKRKPGSKMSSPIEKKIDFSDADIERQPLSPLQFNSLSPI